MLYQPAATRGSPSSHRALLPYGNIKASGLFQSSVLAQFDFQDSLGLVGEREEVQVYIYLLPFVSSPRPFWALDFPLQGLIVLLKYL